MSWRVDFEPKNLLEGQQENITVQVEKARTNTQILKNKARYAVVYSAGGKAWWHKNTKPGGDSKTHVTVRYLGAELPSRSHVYEDGKILLDARNCTNKTALVAEEDDGSLAPDFDSDEEVEPEAGEKAAEN